MENRSQGAYDYLSVQVPEAYEPLYNDCYESLGWEYMESLDVHSGQQHHAEDRLHLGYRRRHRIKNRAKLAALQKELEAELKSLWRLEHKGDTLGLAGAMLLGIAGAAVLGFGIRFILRGQGFGGALLAVPGLAGCAGALPLYLRIRRMNAEKALPVARQARALLYRRFEAARKLTEEEEPFPFPERDRIGETESNQSNARKEENR